MTSAETNAILEVLYEAVVTQQAAAQAPQQQSGRALAEAFDQVRAILARDDSGWESIYGGSVNPEEGLALDDLKKWSPKIRESVVGTPLLGQGFRLRHSYVSKDGLRHGNIPAPTRGKTNIQNLIDDPLNQLHFFGKDARRKRELRLYADGIAFWLGNDQTKKIESIPLSQITDQLMDPDELGIVLAYKREWGERNLSTGKVTPRKEWIFRDLFVDKRVPYINETVPGSSTPTTRVKVSQTHRIFDQHANSMDGMAYGSPDALAAYIWWSISRGATLDGVTMQKALASIAFKATAKTANAAANASLQFATPNGAGSTAVLGAANDLSVLANAGRGYDFRSITPLYAMVATSLSVSVIALTSDTANAGSSYGASATLDLPVRLAMEARRDEHIDLEKRILRWMGIETPDVFYLPFLSGDETYRASQALLLEYAAGIYTKQELRNFVDDLHGRPNGEVPEDDEDPEIVKAKLLAKIDAANAAAATASGVPKQAASPAQGQSNGTGGQSGAGNDLRRDGIGDS